MRKVFGALMATLVVSGCNCDGSNTQVAMGKVEVTAVNHDFGKSCPEPPPPYEVELQTWTLTLKNTGEAVSHLTVFSIDEAHQDTFVWDPAEVPETLGMGESRDIVITFKPQQAGPVQGTLTVKGDRPPEEGEDKHEITLVGEGLGFDPVPKLAMTCSGDMRFPNLDGCATADPYMDFKDTSASGSTSEITVTITNGGCPTLAVDTVAVTTTLGDPGTFALAEGQPTAFTVLGGLGEPGTIRVQFKPTEVNDMLEGSLTFATNDPAMPLVTVNLKGAGSAPTLRVETSVGCGAPDISQNHACCDFKKRGFPCNGRFDIVNSGSEPLTIEKVYLRDNDSEFQLADPTAVIGQEVAATSTLHDAVTVTYVPAAEMQTDYLVVESTAGTFQLELRGGSPPVVQTDPVARIDFNQGLPALDHLAHFQALTITNKATYNEQLDLTISELALTNDRGAFGVVTVADVRCPAGTEPWAPNKVLGAGESTTVCVRFTSDESGGTFTGELRVQSDDPVWPAGKLIELWARATCATNPIALLEVTADDNGGDCPCINQSCPAGGDCKVSYTNPPETFGTLVLSGRQSYVAQYDFDPSGLCVEVGRVDATQYEWETHTPFPSDVISPAGLTNQATTTLTYTMSGIRLIRLWVYDAEGRKSNTAASYSVDGNAN